ncbi:MAG: hypothetical protein A4E35_00865 [Methanoregula sp. PtaU1.Bin051]|nr:MAG: hypothetical protein A4E35_00865 [Methanoregula sp. PtaU1.Bin051]
MTIDILQSALADATVNSCRGLAGQITCMGHEKVSEAAAGAPSWGIEFRWNEMARRIIRFFEAVAGIAM